MQIPRERAPDSTLAFLAEGYDFISRRCRRHGTDLFQARLMLQPTICMLGADAARLFYDSERFQRKGAAPRRLVKTLFGKGGVQSLDGEEHHWRKQLFMSLMTPAGIARLADLAADEWRGALARWEREPAVVLHDAACELLCRAVCAWAGVPLPEADVARRTAQLGALIEGAGAIGPRHRRGRQARREAEAWLSGLIRRVRAGRAAAPLGSALYAVAFYRGPKGQRLSPRVGAVELLNVLRPTVAVARFITFAALALHEHPEQRERLLEADDAALERFVQEVRRFYPFFPVAAARVRRDFEWRGFRFPKGRRVLLDLYGTNHDPRLWAEPGRFDPERFRGWGGGAFDFIPQGGGEHHTGHRCPGEWITIALMGVAVRFLTAEISYRVPAQDLRFSLSEIPSLPRSGFVIADVRRAERPALRERAVGG